MFQAQERPSHAIESPQNAAASPVGHSQGVMLFGNTECSVLKDFATYLKILRVTHFYLFALMKYVD